MSAFGKPIISQKIFDAMVVEIKDSTPGMTLLEAVQETAATFEDDYSLEGLFVYSTPEELQQKQKLEANILTIEKAADGLDSTVNARFCFQGIKQILAAVKGRGAWRLVESRRLLLSLIRLLGLQEGAGGDEEARGGGAGGMKEDDEDDEDEDEDEDAILFQLSVVECFLLIARGGAGSGVPGNFASPQALVLPGEAWHALLSRLDADMGEPRIVAALVECMSLLLAVPGNVPVFLEGLAHVDSNTAAAAAVTGTGTAAAAAAAAASGADAPALRGMDVLALAAKFNSKNAAGAAAQRLLESVGK